MQLTDVHAEGLPHAPLTPVACKGGYLHISLANKFKSIL
jgi:hypothetical protein